MEQNKIFALQLLFLVAQFSCLMLSRKGIGMPYTQYYAIFGCIPVLMLGLSLYK